jgi:hypothetical protein
MITQRIDQSFTTPGLPNIFPYPQRVNTVGWWSADQNVQLSAGNVVAAWTDRTTFAQKVAAASSPFPIILTPNAQNGLPGIATGQTTAGNNAWLRSAGPLAGLDQIDWNVPFAICMALKIAAFTGTEATHILLAYSPVTTNVPGWNFTTRNTSTNIWNFILTQVGFTAINLQTSGGVLQPGQTGTVIVTYDGKGIGTGLMLYVNGVRLGVGPSSTLNTTILGPTRIFQMFNNGSSNSPDTLFEVVMCVGNFQQAQVTAMDQYLNQKWALHF